ncbi:hypothetical protein BH18ACI5_BH18ACI5_04290 [soil metagenome]
MIFLIEYHRAERRVLTRAIFADHDFVAAENARVALEIIANRDKLDREVVLLQAPTEAALRQTHRRYFEDIGELIRVQAQ